MRDDQNWWWPDVHGIYYWPPGITRSETIQSFSEMFSSFGFSKIPEDDVVNFEESVVLYTSGSDPKHAARKLDNGHWSSKIGQYKDIEHTLYGLAAGMYGNPTHFYGK